MLRKLGQIVPESARSSFWLAFGVCLTLCLFIVFVLLPLLGIRQPFGGHGHDGYLELARNIIRGNGFVFEPGGAPNLHRPPLYPLMIAPLTLLPLPLQRPCLILLQSVLVGGIAFLIFCMGERLFGIRTAGIAVIIFLLNPWVYINCKNPMSPVLQGLLYTLFVVLLGRCIYRFGKGADRPVSGEQALWEWGVIGVVGTALALSHGAMLPAAVALLFLAFVIGIVRRNYKASMGSAVSGLIMLLLIAPWTYRNWKVFGHFVPVASNYGFAYFHGLVHWNICGDHAQRPNESIESAALRYIGFNGDESKVLQFWGLKDPTLDAQFNAKMEEHILSKPSIFAKKLLLNSVEYYFPSFVYPFLAVKSFKLEKLGITVFHLFLWGLAIVGIYRAGGQDKSRAYTWLLLGAIGLYAVWYLPIVTLIGHSLYTFGTIPFLSVLAARGLAPR